MDNLFYLEIITPEKQFYVGPAEGLVIPAIDGAYGVQPGHEPVVTAIEPGIARFQVNGVWQEVVVSDGLAEIMPDYTILLVSSAERPKERAEERLRQHQSVREYHLSKAALARAMARLRARPK